MGENKSPRIKSILFVIPSFSYGGAERVLIQILSGLDRNKYRPLVITFHETNYYTHEIPKEVRVLCLNKKSALSFPRLVYELSKIVRKERPEILVSFLTYTNYLTVLAKALSRTDVPHLITVHANLREELLEQRLKWFKGKLVQYLYPKATRIVVVSRGTMKDLTAHFRVPPDKCVVIYNPFDINDIRKKATETISHSWYRENVPIIAACGRLNTQKNYPLLFMAFKAVLNDVNARLVVVGEGEERSRLELLADELGIANNIAFLGFKTNPYKYMAQADVFVLSSWYEGFGNVIVEAMACGVPVISTRCPSGPDEIITDGMNGLLIPPGDERALTNAILRLLREKELRQSIIKAGKKRANDFETGKIINEYEKVFDILANVK